MVRQNRDMTEPVFLPTPRNITVVPGDRAVLKCRVENLGTKTVRIRHQGAVCTITVGSVPHVSSFENQVNCTDCSFKKPVKLT